ncbi:chromosome condensation complex Condensin, subunit G [Fusarium falciforme]|nr:chromosome condensation complex Condensin, subunit G [Fusarium falciforme]
MRTIALDAIHALFNVREGLEDDDVDVEEDMVSMTTIGACLVDWTDPRKCYSPTDLLDTEKKVVNGDVHLEFAMDILEKLQGNIAKDEKKLLATLLGKLHVSPGSTEEKLREAYTEVSVAVEDGLLSDATSRNALYKIHVSLGKIVNALDDQQQQPPYRRSSRSTSVTLDRQTPEEEKSVVSEPRIKEEEEESDDTIVPKEERESLVEELLSDGDDVEMTDV